MDINNIEKLKELITSLEEAKGSLKFTKKELERCIKHDLSFMAFYSDTIEINIELTKEQKEQVVDMSINNLVQEIERIENEIKELN